MKALPEIRYARAENVSIAYSRWGQGDHLVIFTPPFVSNIELMWDLPEWERMLAWAGQHHQIIMIDKRGVALALDKSLIPEVSEKPRPKISTECLAGPKFFRKWFCTQSFRAVCDTADWRD